MNYQEALAKRQRRFMWFRRLSVGKMNCFPEGPEMNALTLRFPLSRIRCYYRPLILAAAALTILCVFWFGSRYPQLLTKKAHVGQDIPSMAWSHEVLPI